MSPKRTPEAILNERQLQVFRLIWDGLNSVEIGKRLSVSQKAVDYHRARVYKKLGVNDIVSAVREGLKRGLLKL
jgi:DNA-binding CsgD family transcriptional regulator